MSKDSFRVTKEFNAALSDIAHYNPNDKTSIKKPIRAKYEGKLLLGEIENTCYVTEDGTRIISSNKLRDIFKVAEDKIDSGSRWARFLGLNWLQSLFSEDFNKALLEPIELTTTGKNRIVGYKAELISELCEVILKGRREGKLGTERQKIIAAQCEILSSALAKVGIVALVDEATGYQFDRKHDTLRVLLAQYINEGLAKWLKTFPDDFFSELDRLYGNQTTKPNTRPKYYGKFINTYIYDPIEEGFVKNKLNELNIKDDGTRKARFRQWLTDFGRGQLTLQIGRVMGIMELSKSIEDFKRKIKRQKSLSIQPELFDLE